MGGTEKDQHHAKGKVQEVAHGLCIVAAIPHVSLQLVAVTAIHGCPSRLKLS